MNAVYWGLTALCIMKHKDALDAEQTIEYVMSCWDDEAGAHKSLTCTTPPPPAPGSPPGHNGGTNPLKLHIFLKKKVPLAHTRDTTHTSFPR
jgi:hypothetical protein